MNKSAKYNIGDIVTHDRMRYRAVIIDVDPIFQASGQYNPGAEKMDASKAPWYRLLVDKSSQITYVEEALLHLDEYHVDIENPKVREFLIKKPDGFHRANKAH